MNLRWPLVHEGRLSTARKRPPYGSTGGPVDRGG